MAPAQRFLQVAAGGAHTCGLTEARAAYCWGDNAELQLGRTGAGNNTPSLVDGGNSFVRLAAGYTHTCGIDVSGTVLCWGSDGKGQLGDGTAGTNRATPTAITLSQPFIDVETGWDETCGATLSGGWCWGSNFLGQLGTGGTDNDPHPDPIAVNASSGFVRLIPYSNRTCALNGDAQAHCWGINYSGNSLGVGSQDNPVLAPTPVLGDRSFIGFDLHYSHICAVEPDWDVYCWGANGSGELGDGTKMGLDVPTLVSLP
jgi:alpha-tubulin suppressor-like RCC1 family protein